MEMHDYRGTVTHQVECFAVWFDFMFFHVLYKAAVCVSVIEKEQIYINSMPSAQLPHIRNYSKVRKS